MFFRIDFFEPELLHPASLDFVAALPNLTNLKIINPTVIGITINPTSVKGINCFKLLNTSLCLKIQRVIYISGHLKG